MTFILTSDIPDYQPHPTERDTNPSGKRLTYAELEERDDRLYALRMAIDFVDHTSGSEDFCANHEWYGRAGFKATLTNIVGHWATQDDAALRTAAAYDVAYQTLYHRLPDCRHEGMCQRGRS
jgi:hypothetical protein